MNFYRFKPFVSIIFTSIIFLVRPPFGGNISAHASESQQSPREEYAVIIDAESTCSRVFVYKFTRESDVLLTVNKQLLTESNTKGLSSFIDDPQKVAKSIGDLLEKAKTVIDKNIWTKTPLSLRSTGDLWFYDETKTKGILEQLNKVFDGIEFFTNEKSIRISNGNDEGVYSWFTVNLLLQRLNGELDKTNAVLDLGGLSVDVTYYTKSDNIGADHSIKKYGVTSRPIQLFSKSYDLGLYSGREGTFTANSDNNTKVTSPCVHTNAKGIKFFFGFITFFVTGVASTDFTGPGVDYKECKKKIESHVTSKNINKITALRQNIVAISLFFDIAQDTVAGGAEPDRYVAVKSYYEAAEKECAKEYDVSNAFKCLDLMYIAVLLEKGFGLPLTTKIQLADTITGFKTTWHIGFAYLLLQRGDQEIENDKKEFFSNIAIH